MLPIQKEVMTKIIDQYKNMPFLWDKKHPSYLDRLLRQTGYKRLLKIYQEVDKDANTIVLKGKLENMRTAYMRELKKVEASKNDSDAEELYSPSLWYFDMFSFLEDHVGRRTASTCVNSEQILYYHEGSHSSQEYGDSKYEEQLDEYTIDDQKNSIDTTSDSPFTKRRKYNPVQNIESPQTTYISVKDEDWEVIGKAIGVQLRDLDEKQKVIAHKLISDTIFNARLGRLTEESSILLNG